MDLLLIVIVQVYRVLENHMFGLYYYKKVIFNDYCHLPPLTLAQINLN